MNQLQEYQDALVRLDELLLSTFEPMHQLTLSWVSGGSVDKSTLDDLSRAINKMYAVMPESIVKAGKIARES